MNDLINVFSNTIGESEVNSVNLRDIHAFVESKQRFADWAKSRLSRAVRDVDYIERKVMTQYNQIDRIDYIVAVDYAKMICMLENNSKGDELRRYFVDCEKRLKELTVPKTYAEALFEAGRIALALEQAEEQKALALAQADYQNKALTTSQVRNTLKTKENKKLKAQLRGYANNYASLTQYVAIEKINVAKISLNSIVRKLKTIAQKDKDYVLLTLNEDKFASTCFDISFLDEHREDIEVMIDMLKNGQSVSKTFVFLDEDSF